MFKRIILLLVFFNCLFLIAQKSKITQKMIDDYKMPSNNTNQHLEYKNMLLSNSKLTGWLYYYRKKSHYHLVKNEFDSVLHYTKKGIQIYNTKQNLPGLELRQMKDIYLNLSIVLTNKKQFKLASTYLLKALEVSKKYKKNNLTSNPYIYGYLAVNYMKMGLKNKALSYNLKIAKDTIFMSSPRVAGSRYNHIGVLYEDFNQTDSAKIYYKKALKAYQREINYPGIRSIHNNLGNLYRTLNNADSAIYHFKKSKILLDKYPNENYHNSKYFTKAHYGYVLIKENKLNESIKLLNRLLDTINSNIPVLDEEIKELKFTIYDYLIEAYQKKKQLGKALIIANKKTTLLEQFHKQVLKEKLQELSLAYDVKEKNESIKELTLKNSNQANEIKQRNYALILLAIFLMAMGVIGVLVFEKKKIKAKYYTVNLEQRLLRSQLNPHFLFNALNTINSLSLINAKNVVPYVNKLASLLRLILKNSREEFVLLKDELSCIEDYLELQSNFSNKFRYCIVKSEKVDEELYIPPMFIQPFIENSIEHGFKDTTGFIEVVIEKDEKNNLLIFDIKDNGIGLKEFKINRNNKHQSFSGQILKERLSIYSKSLNNKAGYKIFNLENKGVRVLLSLPYIQE